jgi:hypothetical protein
MKFIKLHYLWEEEITDDPKRIQRDFCRYRNREGERERSIARERGESEIEESDRVEKTNLF